MVINILFVKNIAGCVLKPKHSYLLRLRFAVMIILKKYLFMSSQNFTLDFVNTCALSLSSIKMHAIRRVCVCKLSSQLKHCHITFTIAALYWYKRNGTLKLRRFLARQTHTMNIYTCPYWTTLWKLVSTTCALWISLLVGKLQPLHALLDATHYYFGTDGDIKNN